MFGYQMGLSIRKVRNKIGQDQKGQYMRGRIGIRFVQYQMGSVSDWICTRKVRIQIGLVSYRFSI